MASTSPTVSTIDHTPERKRFLSAGNNMAFMVLGFFCIVVLAFILILAIGRALEKPILLMSVTPASELPPTSLLSDPLTITSPTANQEVTGQFNVTFSYIRSEALTDVSLRVYDQEHNLIGSNENILLANDNDDGLAHEITVSLDIKSSPVTNEGTLIVFPTSQGETADIAKQQPIKFSSIEIPNQVQLLTPLKNQVLDANSINFRGENHTNNTLYVRLRNAQGDILFQGSIPDNSTNFEQVFTLDNTSPYAKAPGTTGSWELYTQTNGNENVLITLPVRFE